MPVTYAAPGSYMRLTKKQHQIMIVICNGDGTNEKGEVIPIDIDELLDRLVYDTSKASLQFSLRALVNKGLIAKDYEKRRNAKRVVYHATKAGKQAIGFRDASFVGDEEDLSYLDID